MLHSDSYIFNVKQLVEAWWITNATQVQYFLLLQKHVFKKI